MKLAELQTQFMRALHQVDDLSLKNNNLSVTTGLKTTITATETTNTAILTRLKIYRDSMQGIRRASLSKLYPCCKKLLGDDYWQQLVSEFITQHPSTQAEIVYSNQRFIGFIATHPVLTHVPYLLDMAQLEWLWQSCFHTASQTITELSLAQAIEQQGEKLTLILAPGVQLLASHYPLDTIWLFCQSAELAQTTIDLTLSERYFILYREHDRIIIKQVINEAWQIAQLLQNQSNSIIDLCACHQRVYQDALDHESLTMLVNYGIVTWR